ncbi:MAG: carbohydrate kinase [Woeseiaceae bacterium]|nr:carbohydrate kinase [Woeseiaceae bacterium]
MTVAVLGEALIDFIVGEDDAYRPHLGGSPYNVAIGLARQGIPVCYVSPLSDDSFGDQLHASLEREGVQVGIAERSPKPTSLALVTLDAAGQPTYRLYREGIADKDISFEHIKAALPDDLTAFHTGSLAITPSQLPKIRKVFEFMHERGVAISLDVNIRLRASFDTDSYLSGVRSLLPQADIVKASDEDLEPMGFAQDARASAEAAWKEMGDGVMVLTEGKSGALAYAASGVAETGGYPVKDVTDTVGAGDTFHSALLAFLHREGDLSGDSVPSTETLAQAIRFACAAAAINVSRAGCSPPTQAETEAYIAAEKQ